MSFKSYITIKDIDIERSETLLSDMEHACQCLVSLDPDSKRGIR